MASLYSYISNERYVINSNIIEHYIHMENHLLDVSCWKKILIRYLFRQDVEPKVLKMLFKHSCHIHTSTFNESLLYVFLSNNMIDLSIKEVRKIICLIMNNETCKNNCSNVQLTPLLVCLSNRCMCDYEIVKFLFARGSKATDVNYRGGNALHVYLSCCKKIDKKIVSFLVEKGVGLDKIDRENFTPLHYYVKDRKHLNVDTLDFLVSKVIQNYVGDSKKFLFSIFETFLNYVSVYNKKSKKVVDYFLNYLHINYTNENGFSPLMLAADFLNKEFFKYFINLGANINLTNRYGETCATIAILSCEGDIFAEFLNSYPTIKVIEDTIIYFEATNFSNILLCSKKIKMFKQLIITAFTLDPLFYLKHEKLINSDEFSFTINKCKRIICDMQKDTLEDKTIYDIVFNLKNKSFLNRYKNNKKILRCTKLPYYGKCIKRVIRKVHNRNVKINKIISNINKVCCLTKSYWSIIPIEIKIIICNFLSDNDISILEKKISCRKRV
ncbi:147R [Yaba monkey tumor virus]|uniref:147R n=1 Tax=Yaba monkey tumor virus (strain VR587) TaxID=928314 RepID=Q6TUM7_YMTV5|nr:ankyrin repeat protein [Yaba monkey tumor virus]AAR07499.1 147R [Yaba monkey tumor virus]